MNRRDRKTFNVTVKVVHEYSATIDIRARDQAEAEELALREYDRFWRSDDVKAVLLGFPPPWDERDPWYHDPEIDTKFHCVDCGKCTSSSGEYYMVREEIWAASGLGPHDGMLCLLDLERRIGRELSIDDFAAVVPSLEALGTPYRRTSCCETFRLTFIPGGSVVVRAIEPAATTG
jgi:hypothetical protein